MYYVRCAKFSREKVVAEDVAGRCEYNNTVVFCGFVLSTNNLLLRVGKKLIEKKYRKTTATKSNILSPVRRAIRVQHINII